MFVRPESTTNDEGVFDVATFVDSGWAGCTGARKYTTGCTITVRGPPIHHYSHTQSTVALSAGEAELYGLSSRTTKTMSVLQCL